jgi:uncharacterized membrane protein YedE/YeeE
MFEPVGRLLLGLFTGFLFGFLLQKGRVAKYHVIVGQFLLEDWTVVKVMGSAVLVGAIGIFAMRPFDLVALHIKPLMLGGVLAGGALFGIGMGLLGYCPGTSVAACGEGRKDAMAGVVGQLLGAGLFVAGYPWVQSLIRLGDFGKVTLPELTGINAWFWIGAAIVVGMASWFWQRHSHSQFQSEPKATS